MSNQNTKYLLYIVEGIAAVDNFTYLGSNIDDSEVMNEVSVHLARLQKHLDVCNPPSLTIIVSVCRLIEEYIVLQ